MDLLGVGPLELIFVLLTIFLVLGPSDLAKTGRKIGRFLRTVRKSEFLQSVTQVTREMRNLPTRLMREAELEDVIKDLGEDAEKSKNIPQEFQLNRHKELGIDVQIGIDPQLDSNDSSAASKEESVPDSQVQAESNA